MLKNTLPHLALCLLLPLSACSLDKLDPSLDSSAAEYREALPDAKAIALRGPESAGSSQRLQNSGQTPPESTGDQAAEDEAEPAGSGVAQWYAFTREIRDNVNHVTREVLTLVSQIAQLEPTRFTANSAEWGPHTEALSPVTYRFMVVRVQEGEYKYRLEGRPKTSTADADYLVLLEGKGYSEADERHGDGEFRFHPDNARTLDPSDPASHDGDAERWDALTVSYDLPRDPSTGAVPYTIYAHLSGSAPDIEVTSKATNVQGGSLVVVTQGDVDEAKNTQLEDIVVESEWIATGAGRSDILISGGDLPKDPSSVQATECWGTDFARVYYTDSVSFEPTEGDASACIERTSH
ncbi:MAG TPA: hypothetical protein VFQ61_02760 [Polyangiaceae bacterium]|nr:hypothetical protein [Polyangiaceae bacterium]